MKIFEDAVLDAQLLTTAAAPGHVRIHPQKPVNALEELSQAHAQHLFSCASLAATALFETMGAHGTNIVIQDEDKLRVDVYARTQEDGLGLMWDPEPADQQALKQTASKIKDAFWYIGKKDQQPLQTPPKKTTTTTSQPTASDADDYRVKQLRRSP